MLQIIIKV